MIGGDRLRFESIKISDVDFTGRADIHFESDLGLRDPFFAGHSQDGVIGKSMSLAAYRCARICFGSHGIRLVVWISDAPLNVAIVAATDQKLRSIGTNETKALHVEIELDDLGYLAGKTANRNWNRFDGAGKLHVLWNIEFPVSLAL